MSRVITIERDVSAAARTRCDEFRRAMTLRGTLVVNLLSSPGAGKTSLLAATAIHFGRRQRMAVLVGDIATDRDAQRLAPLVPAVQLTTGGACHLEYSLVERGYHALACDEQHGHTGRDTPPQARPDAANAPENSRKRRKCSVENGGWQGHLTLKMALQPLVTAEVGLIRPCPGRWNSTRSPGR